MGCFAFIMAPLLPFVGEPQRIGMMATALFTLFLWLLFTRYFRAWPVLVAAVVWGLWYPWEAACMAEGADIRIDLIVIGPLVLLVTIWGLRAGFSRRRVAPSHDETPAGPTEVGP